MYPKVKDVPEITLNFTKYLLDKIACYIDENVTDRRELLIALGEACRILFCEQTPLSIKEQCQEIDAFCDFLKFCAMGDTSWKQ